MSQASTWPWMACVHCSVYLTSPGVILDLAMTFECFFVCWLVFKCQIKESGKLQCTILSSSCWKGLQHSTQTFWNISTAVSSFSSIWGHPQVSPKWPLVPSTSLLLEFSTCRCCCDIWAWTSASHFHSLWGFQLWAGSSLPPCWVFCLSFIF